MSLCIRTISNKLTPFVNARNHVRKTDCRLPKDVSSSAFLKEFLGRQAMRNCASRMTRSRSVNTFYQNVNRMAFSNKYRNGSRALLIQNSPEGNNEASNSLWQYDVAHSKRLNAHEMKAVENLVIPEISFAINTCYEKDNLRNNNWIHTYATESLKNNSNVAINSLHSCNEELQPSIKEQSTLLSTKSLNDIPESNQIDDMTNDNKKATPDQLDHVFHTLREQLPKFFYNTMDYTIYDAKIVFVNNFKGVETVGLYNYVKQLSMVRALAHIRYLQVQMEIIKMTKHPEEGIIKVRWRVRCLKYFKTLFKFFRNKVWKYDKNQRDHEIWFDGFSTYYVNENGKITKHIIDKMMPHEDPYEVTKKNPLASKLALLMGAVSIDNFSSKQYHFK